MLRVFQDWASNRSNLKGRLILVSFRIAHLATINKLFFIFLLPHLVIHRLLIEWILGVELPYKTIVGSGLVIHHGHALVINDKTVIGNNCIFRHCTTIGNKILPNGDYSGSPILGNNVELGSHVCIIGPITIGNNVVIGAGAVVVKDIPSNCVVVGNPARIIKNSINNYEKD